MTASEADVKFGYKRLEPSISRFIKILQIDLDRLHQHRTNIHKFRKSKELESLDKEQINASQTCQQLKSNIRQLELTRSRLEDDALAQFDEKTSNIRMQAITSTVEFLDHYGNIDTDLNADLRTLDDSEGSLSPEQEEAVQLQVTKPDLQVEKSWHELQEDLVDLNGLMHEFSGLVTSQQEHVDEIESHVETASENVESGVLSLATAAKLKYAVYPVAGALVGGCVGGPIGLLAGIKLGAAAAVTGGIAGFTGGKMLKKYNSETENTEGEEEKDEEKEEEESEVQKPESQSESISEKAFATRKPYVQQYGDT